MSTAELLALRFSPYLPMKKYGWELIGPTTTAQGSFDDRRTRRELVRIGGSVAGELMLLQRRGGAGCD